MKKIYFLLFMLISSVSFGQVINEIDADTPGTDMAEFIELLWTPNTALDGLVVVLYNGSSDTSYAAFDLDGQSTDANGFYILGNTGIISAGDTDIGADNALQNGADAVALYTGDDTDFPEATPATDVNLVDAIVYGTGDADDTDLMMALGETTQWDESLNGANSTESLQLTADGTSYETKVPTFRNDNNSAVCPISITGTDALCDDFTTGVDTYTVTVDFTGGGAGAGTYTITPSSGSLDLSSGDPDVDASGTITIAGIDEGTDFSLTIQDGALCDLMTDVTSPVCEPSLDLPLYEGFDYTIGEDLGLQPNWNNYSGSDNPILVASGSLSYPDLLASTGNSITMEGGFVDSEIVFTPVTSGAVYASFILNVTDMANIMDLTDGGYVAILVGNGFNARLWIRPNTDPVGTTYDIALTNASSGSGFVGNYSIGDSVFIVMSYDIDSGAINGWVNPAGTDFGGSAPTALLTDTDATPDTLIDRFALRQDSTNETPAMTIDELRIGTSWADVTPTTLSVEEFNANAFNIFPNPTSNGIVNITTANSDAMSVSVFDILGKQVLNETVSNNTLNVSTLNSGVYIIKIVQNGNTSTKKLVIK
ncbi:T9SS type A sorting domain-containing protein [Oceanihabitans sp.]|nr:T9SS type A sorting domain-containing protein [Oceanihabitans sp.]